MMILVTEFGASAPERDDSLNRGDLGAISLTYAAETQKVASSASTFPWREGAYYFVSPCWKVVPEARIELATKGL